MAYATQDDLVPLRLSQNDLVELTSDTDEVDATVVQGALDEASATVDAYCGQRYQTPLQPSLIVKKITVDLTIYALASRRRETSPKETWAINYQAAMKTLRDIAAGNASLDTPANSTQPQMSSNEVSTPTTRQVFDDDNMRGFC